ncbi:glutathione peroxidase [Acetobacter nitrogenifigens DSM 23921 = NBRC 105050]|uniref:Glutathione peroxidase n=1 Tax=Acetobacter nitrogenifigens DSM 23921 = NBRC 105050 TaxID=1120919 RepID=A0A511XCE6_9PROT|nr:glutathione peroxidase [Acetobacter nitrogenifigens]GBQ92157.1 glutathione peroxidase [Acetobacter nitrogenifigens DSM 23921 = NBRC 105050]GEN60643.1 glutathione peroxidase [Acetobacter nitrogenifigens DSM 23921 = NBRC 105050]
MQCAYDFSMPGLEGGTVDFAAWRGKPLLIVNTASKCGFTPQYEGLQALWSEMDRELIVIGVPSNDFGDQEPGGGKEIATFCSRNYGVSFPMTEKAHVRGRDATPLFRWLAEQGGFLARPRWNFFKYLIDRQGRLTNWFSSISSPDSRRVREAAARLVLDH